jgi:hypothetical protein
MGFNPVWCNLKQKSIGLFSIFCGKRMKVNNFCNGCSLQCLKFQYFLKIWNRLEMSQGILIQLVPFLVRVKNFLLPFPVVDGSTPTLDLQLNGLLLNVTGSSVLCLSLADL